MSKKTINYVLEGEYKNEEIYCPSKSDTLKIIGGSSIKKERIVSYTILDENTKNSSEYSFWKGVLGVTLFGSLGVIAGIGGKNKSSKEYLISLEWKDGNKSLILIDDEYYKVFVKSMF